MRKGDFIFAPEIRSRLHSVGELIPVERDFMDGPAERLRFDGAKGEIGFIRAMSRHFCHTCNRLRLTADGQLRPCLLFDKQIDIKGLLRQGCTDDTLAAAFYKAVKHKREAHGFAMDNPFKVADQMVDIGG
jgi:cyclic pyranopterin phosphate synthase